MISDRDLRKILANITLLKREDQIEFGAVLRIEAKKDSTVKARVLRIIHEVLAESATMTMRDFIVVLVAVCERDEVVKLIMGSSDGDDDNAIKPSWTPAFPVTSKPPPSGNKRLIIVAAIIILAVAAVVVIWLGMT